MGKSTNVIDAEKEEAAKLDKVLYEDAMRVQKKKMALLAETKDRDSALDIDEDTYTMAFKALHWKSMNAMELNED